jgi:hypothetical protein
MVSIPALNRELEKNALKERIARSEWVLRQKTRKSLVRQIKAELPVTIQRQRETGWPGATPERVVVPGLWRPSRTVSLTLVCGNPLSVPLDFNGQRYGYWLGTDGRLYKVNSYMWIDPKPGMEPYWKLELSSILDTDKLEHLLHGLKFL